MTNFINKVLELLSLKSQERREYDLKVDRNDSLIIDLLDVLARTKPRIEKLNDDYHFILKGLKVQVSSYSYIYIKGFDLEYSSANVRSSFGMAVRTIHESQSNKGSI